MVQEHVTPFDGFPPHLPGSSKESLDFEESCSDSEHWGQARSGHALCIGSAGNSFFLILLLTENSHNERLSHFLPLSRNRGKWKITFPKNLHTVMYKRVEGVLQKQMTANKT